MGMSVGPSGGPRSDINITPLVDVVLVLLIIFMVITPLLTKKFWVHTPKQEKEEVEQPPTDAQPPLVMHVAADGVITVNGVTLTPAEVPDRLRRMFAARTDHVIFFDAADDVPFATAMQAMDAARDGGAVTIATLTQGLGGSAGSEDSAPAAAPPSGS